jgi:beta-mannanase
MTNEEVQAEIARFAAEDEAAAAAVEEFRALGRSHAAFAIDAAADYEDSRGSHEDNLRDTLAEQHGYAAQFLHEAAVDAYNATWESKR